MSVEALPSARRVTWLRRRRALAGIWEQFRHHRPGMIGLVVLVAVVLMALAAPLLADESGLRAVNATGNPTFASPSEFGPLGTDDLGRSVMTQFIWGSRISLLVGLAATLLAMLIGSAVGIAAGFFGGWISSVLMRITEWFLVIPFLPLAIALAAILGPSIRNIIIVIGITSWPSTTRLIHAQVLTLKERSYVDRSRALGASDWHVMTRHIVPNVFPLILANTTLTVPIVILSEATLVLPRARRSLERVLGSDARRRLRGRRDHARGVVVHRAARPRDHARGAGLHAGGPGAGGDPRSPAARPARMSIQEQPVEEPAPPAGPLLSVRDLHVTYRSLSGAVPAVRGVSFDLEVGHTLGIAGESGCGKSTMAGALLRLLPRRHRGERRGAARR